MIRRKIVSLFHNDSPIIFSALSRNLHASSVSEGKERCKRQKRNACEKVSVAIILCGCGNLDGTDISEAMSTAIHVSQKNMKPQFYAPNIEICGLTDHCTKEADSNSTPRNALVEAARIARSDIQPLCECQACLHGALVIPGGFAGVRTMSDFAEKGADCTILPDLEKVIEDFSCQKKPIGAICISSVLIARVLKGVKITLGKNSPKDDWPYAEAIPRAKEMGARIEMKDVKGVTRCKKYNVFSTPAWMYQHATYTQIYSGIGKLVGMLKKNMKNN